MYMYLLEQSYSTQYIIAMVILVVMLTINIFGGFSDGFTKENKLISTIAVILLLIFTVYGTLVLGLF